MKLNNPETLNEALERQYGRAIGPLDYANGLTSRNRKRLMVADGWDFNPLPQLKGKAGWTQRPMPVMVVGLRQPGQLMPRVWRVFGEC